MKTQVAIAVVALRVVIAQGDESVESMTQAATTPNLPKLFHPEGWRSTGQSADQAIHEQKREGGRPCDR